MHSRTLQYTCREEDETGHDIIFPTDECQDSSEFEDNDLDFDNNDLDHENTEHDNEDENTNPDNDDPIQKHQFDNNRNTCLTNNYPEMFLDKNGRRHIALQKRTLTNHDITTNNRI